MVALITSDIHMESAAIHAYRWELFPWLAQQAREHCVDAIFILGDLTSAKDRHPASVVNKMADGFAEISAVAPVFVIMANHDFIDPANPFFGFLTQFDNVVYAREPLVVDVPMANQPVPCLLLPNVADPVEEWKPIAATFAEMNHIFMHQTFRGALCENGTRDESGPVADFLMMGTYDTTEIYSGDIHVPQTLGRVQYVGAPYRIDFGDQFKPRVLLIDEEGWKHDLHFPCPDKHLVEITREGEIQGLAKARPGDLVKVRVRLQRADLVVWPRIRQAVREMAAEGGLVLLGPELRISDDAAAPVLAPKVTRQSPSDLVSAYADREELDADLASIGQTIIEEVSGGR